jgi:hypothetical protein
MGGQTFGFRLLEKVFNGGIAKLTIYSRPEEEAVKRNE